jgi:HK97 family phage prohead protease
MSRIGQFIERICKGAFKKAIQRNDNIRLLLNHNWERDLGGTKEGNLTLTEDNIGLYARATITDKDVIEKARNGSLVGWSFGFNDREVENSVEHGIPTRDVKDLDLYEVSILDRTKTPAYEGTLISVRSDDNVLYFGEPCITDIETQQTREEDSCPECQLKPPTKPGGTSSAGVKEIDYSKYENLIKEMKGEI